MSSDFRPQVLDQRPASYLYQDNHRTSDDINESEKNLDGNNILKSSHSPQETVAYNHAEYEYDDLDAEYDEEIEKTSTSYHKRDEREKNIYKALIKDQKHFEYLLHSRITKERNEGILNFKDTFPKDPAVQRSWVKKIFDAILDLDSIIDKKTKYHNNSSQAARRIRDGYYPDIEIEKTAWKLMLNARDAQLGVRLIEKYHGVKIEEPVRNGTGVFETWADRMNAIINTLRVSKAACKQLMDPHYLDRLMKKNNKRINTERDIQNQLGRKLLDLKVIPLADVEKEVLKLQSIKEAHRSAAPPRTPRIKKEILSDDSSVLSLREGSPLITRKKNSNSRKRKKTRQEKKSTRQGDQKTPEFSLDNCEKAFPSNPHEVSIMKRQRTDGTLHSSNVQTTDQSTNIKIASTDNLLSSDGICVYEKFDPNNFSIPIINPYVPPDSKSGRKYQDTDRFESNRTYAFQLDPDINVFNPISTYEPDQLGILAQNPQPTIMTDPKSSRIYSEMICGLLSIDTHIAMLFSLKELRLYAHAYNSMFVSYPWTHPELGSKIAKGCCVYDEFTGQSYHICHYFPNLSRIALLRGDIDVNFSIIPGTEYEHLFSTNGNEHMDQALGIIENPCGLSLLSSSNMIKKDIY
ncbi:hypothetical protein GcM3_007008b [Golovinomyces cichoracearum]|uniref:Uncharacterized protein n=1 Tax=Golovinomyces cichoracearum TaxID=62708 RepID=A0A420JAQ4_9PEZI|nr:hypothetical protein GcM3_007008b [Golovinomyces cichoracearum]